MDHFYVYELLVAVVIAQHRKLHMTPEEMTVGESRVMMMVGGAREETRAGGAW